MPKYNVYKLDKSKEDALLAKLEFVGLSQIHSKNQDDFILSFYLSIEPDQVDIWWTDIYAEYIGQLEAPKNKAYFAVLIVSNENLLYAISMGKSHFYLKDFCDTDFGLNLAERIGDSSSLKLKNSKLFGGKKNKTIIAYQEHSEYEFDSGESIHYVKSKTINPDRWGEVVSFGNSVQFNLKIEPDELPQLIRDIEVSLQEQPNIILPRATAIIDKTKIGELDDQLTGEILNNSGSLQPAEATVSGVDFIFLDSYQYRFILDRRKRSDAIEELNLQALISFIEEYNIDLRTNLNEIKIKVSNESGSVYTKALKYFLDYVDDDRHFLFEGKWHVFNQNYIDFLRTQVDDKIKFEIGTANFSENEYQTWKVGLPEEERKGHYPESYFNLMQERNGYRNLDRSLDVLQRRYKIEKMDLYMDQTLYFVKMGTPQKLGYVIDQSLATIKILQNRASTIQIDNENIIPKAICLWLIIERQTNINQISEIKSLIFLMKLAEWQRQCTNAGYDPIVRIGYKGD